MTAGIFHHHGVWTGTPREGPSRWNPKGFFEHRDIKKLILRRWGNMQKVLEKGFPEYQHDFAEEVERVIREDGYQEGPWLYKMSALYWRIWSDFDPVFVGVYRPSKSVASSNWDTGMVGKDKDKIERMVDLHMQEINKAAHCVINTQEVVNRDYRTLETAFKRCGLEFDPNIVDDFVDESLWTH